MRTFSIKALRILGVVLVLGGLAHAAGVTQKYASVGWSERHKAELVAFIGLVHLAGGALDLLAAGMLRRDEPSARRAAALACGFTIAWTALDLPILFAEAKLFFQVMPVVYLATHTALLVALVLPKAR